MLKHNYVSKFKLFNALAEGGEMQELGLQVVNAIEREDGSNSSYNVTGYDKGGLCKTVYTKAV
jgi:hypothetical protein